MFIQYFNRTFNNFFLAGNLFKKDFLEQSSREWTTLRKIRHIQTADVYQSKFEL